MLLPGYGRPNKGRLAQEAVHGFGWLHPFEMADGSGLAKTTPGPLILVTQFVGFLAAFRAPEPFSPFVARLLGAGIRVVHSEL